MKQRKPRKTMPYCERIAPCMPARPLLRVCRDCNFTMKRDGKKCPVCKGENVCSVGLTARPPRKNKTKAWKEFWSRFAKGSHPKGCR